MSIYDIIEKIEPLDILTIEKARQHWDSIAKPLHSLGLLEDIIVSIAGITKSDKICLDKRCVSIMCSDNGVVCEGVTQTGSEVTAIVTENFTKGMATINQMSKIANTDVIPIDIGISKDMSYCKIINHKIAYGTNNIAIGPAMTYDMALECIQVGIDTVHNLKKSEYKIIATGEMGIGNTTTSSAIAAVLLNESVEKVTGKGAGLSREGINHKVDIIKKAIEVNNPKVDDIIDVISKIGGFDIAGLVGIFIGGAYYRVPIIIDGFISAVSALCAVKLCPNVKGYIIASHVSKEPAGKLIIDALGLSPMLHCEMCLGEGTGAVAIIPLLDMALEVYNSMPTFDEANIEKYIPLES